MNAGPKALHTTLSYSKEKSEGKSLRIQEMQKVEPLEPFLVLSNTNRMFRVQSPVFVVLFPVHPDIWCQLYGNYLWCYVNDLAALMKHSRIFSA